MAWCRMSIFHFKIFRACFFTLLVLTPFAVFAREKKITPFQENIKTCLATKEDVQKIQNLNQLYDFIDKNYDLKTTETLYREVLYKEKGQMLKMKVEKGLVSIYKVTDDDTLKLINNDARQKGLTDESSINQLLMRAEVREDYLKVKEVRSGQTLLQFGKERDQYKAISFEKVGSSWKLECTNKESSDICICRK